jgi:hypothetical protein
MKAIFVVSLFCISLSSFGGNAGPDAQLRCKADGLYAFFDVTVENTFDQIKGLRVTNNNKSKTYLVEEGIHIEGSETFFNEKVEITITGRTAVGKLEKIPFACIKI